MEHLTKQQIVLLTLLVSFVTSIATGIITVSLLDEAPQGVTQTINRVVEHTIEKVTSTDQGASVSNVAPVSFEDQTAIAAEKVSDSLVRIRPRNGDSTTVTGLGLVVSNQGVIVTDKNAVSNLGDLVAVFSDGREFPIRVIESQINGDIVFAVAITPTDSKINSVMSPVSQASSIKLGQTIFALSGKDSNSISQGIVEKVEGNQGTTTINLIRTNISRTNVLLGSPLFTITGDVVGIETSSVGDGGNAAFYPLSLLKSSIPVLSK